MVRPMVADGVFYPSDPAALKSRLQRAFIEARVPRGHATVVVAPYGSYDLMLSYIAGSLRATDISDPEFVLLLAPPDASLWDRILIPESDAFATPFGEIPVHREICRSLVAADELFTVDEVAHLQNHSIEVFLPAIHYLFGPVPIVPLLVGRLSGQKLVAAQSHLTRVTTEARNLVVGGANLSGFTDPSEADARARKLIRLVMTGPGERILENLDTLEDAPRSLSTLVLSHLLAGEECRPAVLARGTFETEFEGHVGGVVFASIAYFHGT